MTLVCSSAIGSAPPLDAIRLGPCAHPREQGLAAPAERKLGTVVGAGDEPVERHGEIHDDVSHLDSFANRLPVVDCQLLAAPGLIGTRANPGRFDRPGPWRGNASQRDGGGGGIRTRVFRVRNGASPSAAGEKVLGSPPLTGGLRRPQPRCDVPPSRETRPGGEPLSMTPAIRPSG